MNSLKTKTKKHFKAELLTPQKRSGNWTQEKASYSTVPCLYLRISVLNEILSIIWMHRNKKAVLDYKQGQCILWSFNGRITWLWGTSSRAHFAILHSWSCRLLNVFCQHTLFKKRSTKPKIDDGLYHTLEKMPIKFF